jgi:diguanylate cyclase (GGDEF)-like protein
MDVQSRELSQEEYKRYVRYANGSQLRGKRVAAWMVLAVIVIYLYWDIRFLGWQHPNITDMLLYRIVLCVPIVVWVYCCTYSKNMVATLDRWVFAGALMMGVSIIINMYQYGSLGHHLRVDGLLLYTFILYSIPACYFYQKTLAGLLVLSAYCGLMIGLDLNADTLTYNIVYLVIFNLVGSLHSRNRDNRAKLEYSHKLILKRIADTDQLTGIYNRHGFDGRMAQLMAEVDDGKALLALAVLDIDFFKKLNDSLGHLRGDCCLREVAQTLLNLRQHSLDLVVRFGGEEFIVVFYQPDGNRKRLLESITNICPIIESQKFNHPNSTVSKFVTISAGVSIYEPNSGMSRSDLMQQADKALYRSKDSGRNKCSIADQGFEHATVAGRSPALGRDRRRSLS